MKEENGSSIQTAAAPEKEEEKILAVQDEGAVRGEEKQEKLEQGEIETILRLLAPRYGMASDGLQGPELQALRQAMAEDPLLRQNRGTEEAEKVSESREQRERVPTEEKTENPGTMSKREVLQVLRYREHLEQEGQALKKKFPAFDLEKEMQNPRFAAMVSPQGGLCVEEAFYALHHRRIEQQQKEGLVRQMSRAFGHALRSGERVPRPNGSDSRRKQPGESKPYSRMNPEERAIYKQQICQSSVFSR